MTTERKFKLPKASQSPFLSGLESASGLAFDSDLTYVALLIEAGCLVVGKDGTVGFGEHAAKRFGDLFFEKEESMV
jgi:hypothetical protein